MPLSSNSVIHFTSEKENLLNILSDNFRVFYCTEEYSLSNYLVTAKVPMVSFCDIPLSEIKDHIGKYGNYGIGLTKDWAVRMGLNPVLYIEPRSHIASSIGKAFELYGLTEGQGTPSESQYAIAELIRYMKNYQGKLVRKNSTNGNYRFSDEREWRYAPPHDSSYEMLIGKEEYDAEKERHDKSIEHLRLRFEPNDIKYIIIRDDDEIAEFVNHLRQKKGNCYSYHDIERLTTRLLTTEQIISDI